ncbi:MAG: diguanylate cyclase [Gammaproteobacteria bacterium]|nr:diguanylate cyclase [Gammaproteobacteria bacterium]MCF6231038.1 diguanylate cyclase [Gammaproteobacteria bacterium]
MTDNLATGSSQNTIIVLLVDDQKMVAEAIRYMIAEEADIELHFCDDPSQAVQLASELQPTVILQDLVMPDVDGYTLLRFYRANPATASIPVVVLSSKDDPQDKSQAFTNGANDYLVKLPDKIELIARIRAQSKSYLAQKERDEAFQQMQKLQQELEESNQKLEESNMILQRLSTLDGLTGLANRRHFDETLAHEWKLATREKTPLSIILLDIDFFKKYNDNYGHQGGDDCLRTVSAAMNRAIRRPGDFIARYGGEEFVVILPNTHCKGAEVIAEEMRLFVENEKLPHEYSEVSDYVTISLGIAAMRPVAGDKPEALVGRADKALYKAKGSGRNCYIIDC